MSHFIQGECFAEVYDQLLRLVYESPDAVCSPRGQEVRELISPSIRVFDPTNRFYSSPARSTPMRYVGGEFAWYFGLRNDAEFITKYSAFWNQIKNSQTDETGMLEAGKVNSSYGHLLMAVKDATWNGVKISQWEWAIRSLLKDKDSRQAILHINRPAHQVDWVKDFPCTMNLQFMIRNNNLHLVVGMRSNDLVMGTTFDFPMFAFFQETMLEHLQTMGMDELRLGHLTLTATSSHIYERNYETVVGMVSNLTVGKHIGPIGKAPVDCVQNVDGSLDFLPAAPLQMLLDHADGKGNYVGTLKDQGLDLYAEMARTLTPKIETTSFAVAAE